MKRLEVSRWHEKLVLAAIILSCGLVMQAEPPTHQAKARDVPDVGHYAKQVPAAHATATEHTARAAKLHRMRNAVPSP
jgi:hypothetical protein